MAFSAAEALACRRLVDLALAEDLGTSGDVTSQATIPLDLQGRAVFVARAAGVLAGLPAAEMVVNAVNSNLAFAPLLEDGRPIVRGDRLAHLAGSMRSILAAERTALNFLQHLSGVATLTRKYVEAIAGLKSQILDTRKTLPGWRLLEKYAVRCGGGSNHRVGLYDAVLIKDNHLAALKNERFPITACLDAARGVVGEFVPIEVEVETLDQLDEALDEGFDLVLLDNMSLNDLREAVARRDRCRAKREEHVFLEASGGITLESIRSIAETGVDRISVGALTHSAPALDIALDYER